MLCSRYILGEHPTLLLSPVVTSVLRCPSRLLLLFGTSHQADYGIATIESKMVSSPRQYPELSFFYQGDYVIIHDIRNFLFNFNLYWESMVISMVQNFHIQLVFSIFLQRKIRYLNAKQINYSIIWIVSRGVFHICMCLANLAIGHLIDPSS